MDIVWCNKQIQMRWHQTKNRSTGLQQMNIKATPAFESKHFRLLLFDVQHWKNQMKQTMFEFQNQKKTAEEEKNKFGGNWTKLKATECRMPNVYVIVEALALADISFPAMGEHNSCSACTGDFFYWSSSVQRGPHKWIIYVYITQTAEMIATAVYSIWFEFRPFFHFTFLIESHYVETKNDF